MVVTVEPVSSNAVVAMLKNLTGTSLYSPIKPTSCCKLSRIVYTDDVRMLAYEISYHSAVVFCGAYLLDILLQCDQFVHICSTQVHHTAYLSIKNVLDCHVTHVMLI
jgi:hypothetical protein